MVLDEDVETIPHWTSSLTPPLPSSPMQAPSALPPSSKDNIKNEHCYLCLDVPVESRSLVRGSDVDFTCPTAMKLQIGITAAKWDGHLPHTGVSLFTLHLNQF
ncbi:hypothetical protein PAXRUDRAFT_22814 [Paxillus rubicundulus Ve08.2h10]|uniref:Uncharacterized protein n=1 Tax=Paxillus rubicundulus Ve08.2h10 TaxID=930991 RepID=A0A0D0BJH0_9AGAM|nr:hypothetical protein PAXRUDRAFT_22814 [Paxillus rubicundulus Ve08.2h10]